ncbi:hypothetical protein H8959_001628 [Pygathrix nigripes]
MAVKSWVTGFTASKVALRGIGGASGRSQLQARPLLMLLFLSCSHPWEGAVRRPGRTGSHTPQSEKLTLRRNILGQQAQHILHFEYEQSKLQGKKKTQKLAEHTMIECLWYT